jgi:hypothetical protein
MACTTREIIVHPDLSLSRDSPNQFLHTFQVPFLAQGLFFGPKRVQPFPRIHSPHSTHAAFLPHLSEKGT